MSGKMKKEALILSQRMITGGIFDMWLETPIAKDVKPGQFVGVYPADKSTLLPRPISVCEVDKKKSAIRLVYRVVGAGTDEFSKRTAGDKLDILGPLGNGFDLEKAAGKNVTLIGGGIGIPPLLGTAKELFAASKETHAATISAVMGYRDNDTFLSDEFLNFAKVHIASEDGSVGTKGNVIDALKEQEVPCDVIFACGPMPMLRGIKAYAGENNIKAYLSLEERMACGVGACLGCVCKTKNVDEHSHVNNARICTDGPVFDADDLDI